MVRLQRKDSWCDCAWILERNLMAASEHGSGTQQQQMVLQALNDEQIAQPRGGELCQLLVRREMKHASGVASKVTGRCSNKRSL